MDLELEGKSALVVGASRGLGRGIAMTLAQEGVQVGAIARTEGEIVSLIADMGGETKGHWGMIKDLVPDNAPAQIAEEIKSQNRQVDILIHNLGGTLGIRDPFCTVDEWRSVWRLNLEISKPLLAPSHAGKKMGTGSAYFLDRCYPKQRRNCLLYCQSCSECLYKELRRYIST